MAVNGKLNLFNYSLNHLVSLLLLLQLIGGKPKAWPAWQGREMGRFQTVASLEPQLLWGSALRCKGGPVPHILVP